jgi:hypothetical protein
MTPNEYCVGFLFSFRKGDMYFEIPGVKSEDLCAGMLTPG